MSQAFQYTIQNSCIIIRQVVILNKLFNILKALKHGGLMAKQIDRDHYPWVPSQNIDMKANIV